MFTNLDILGASHCRYADIYCGWKIPYDISIQRDQKPPTYCSHATDPLEDHPPLGGWEAELSLRPFLQVGYPVYIWDIYNYLDRPWS